MTSKNKLLHSNTKYQGTCLVSVNSEQISAVKQQQNFFYLYDTFLWISLPCVKSGKEDLTQTGYGPKGPVEGKWQIIHFLDCQSTHIIVTDDNHPVRGGKTGSSTPFALQGLSVKVVWKNSPFFPLMFVFSLHLCFHHCSLFCLFLFYIFYRVFFVCFLWNCFLWNFIKLWSYVATVSGL